MRLSMAGFLLMLVGFPASLNAADPELPPPALGTIDLRKMFGQSLLSIVSAAMARDARKEAIGSTSSRLRWRRGTRTRRQSFLAEAKRVFLSG